MTSKGNKFEPQKNEASHSGMLQVVQDEVKALKSEVQELQNELKASGSKNNALEKGLKNALECLKDEAWLWSKFPPGDQKRKLNINL